MRCIQINETDLPVPTSCLDHETRDAFFQELNKNLVQLHEAIPLIDSRDFSIYTGILGIIWTHWKLSQNSSLPSAFRSDCLRWAISSFQQLGSKKLRHRESGSPVCHPETGRIFVGFLLSLEDPQDVGPTNHYVQAFLDLCYIETDEFEFLYGDAGLLYCLRVVANRLQSTGHYQRVNACMQHVVKRIMASGKAQGQTVSCNQKIIEIPLTWKWHGKRYLGAAHGIVGVLYQLLQSRHCLNEKDLKLIESTIHAILEIQRECHGNIPSSPGSSNMLVQFCHGAVGLVILLQEAMEVFPKNKHVYTEALDNALNVIFAEGLLVKGVGLCHGISGNAFALMMAHGKCRHSIQKTMQYILHYATFASTWQHRTSRGQLRLPDHPWSLFEGVCGLILMYSALIDKMNAWKFPFFADD